MGERKLNVEEAKAHMAVFVTEPWHLRVNADMATLMESGLVEAVLCDDGEVRYRKTPLGESTPDWLGLVEFGKTIDIAAE